MKIISQLATVVILLIFSTLMFKQISTRFNKFQHVSTNFNMTHSRDSISTQDSKSWLKVLFCRLSLILKISSRIGYELYLMDLPGKHLLSPFPGYGKIPGLCIQFSGISISRACLTI